MKRKKNTYFAFITSNPLFWFFFTLSKLSVHRELTIVCDLLLRFSLNPIPIGYVLKYNNSNYCNGNYYNCKAYHYIYNATLKAATSNKWITYSVIFSLLNVDLNCSNSIPLSVADKDVETNCLGSELVVDSFPLMLQITVLATNVHV